MTTHTKLGNPSEGLFTLQDIDRALFSIDDINTAIEECLVGDSNNAHSTPNEEVEISSGELGIIFKNETIVVFSYPEGDINISCTKGEMLIYKFFIDNPGVLHRIKTLQAMLQQRGLDFSQEEVIDLIKSINAKLGDKLFFSCGISHYSQIPVLHGVRTVFKKNGKIVVVNKLRRTIEWEGYRVVIDDMKFFLKIYECFKHISFDDGVALSQEYAEEIRKLKIPLEEKKGGKFSL